jgi:hypothetical protein
MRRFFGTLADACLRPMTFYTHLARTGATRVTLFAWICLLLGNLGQAAWGLVFLPLLDRLGRSAAAETGAESGGLLEALLPAAQTAEQLAQLDQLEAQLWASLLLAPVVAYFSIHLLAGLVHFSAQPWRHPEAEPVGYEVTYRFVVYAQAPMALALLPSIGSIASVYSFVLLCIAISKLHRVRTFGLLGAVVFPVLLLSWLWGGEALPRISAPLARAAGIELRLDRPAEVDGVDVDVDQQVDGDDDEYPAMPAADRDHDVEIFSERGWQYTERFWVSSAGRFSVRQLVAATPSEPGQWPLVFELKRLDGGTRTPDAPAAVFLLFRLPTGVTVDDDTRVEPAGTAVVADGLLQAQWPAIDVGATAVLAVTAHASDGRALLKTGASVGLQ